MTEKPNPKPYGSPVVGYVRSAQREDPALDEAEARIRAYCAEQGWNLARIFREEGVSSVAAWRPQFDEMVRGLQRREWVGVIFADPHHISSQNNQVRRAVAKIEETSWLLFIKADDDQAS